MCVFAVAIFPGSIYFGKCPREHYIPIYLIVGGSFGILKNLSNIVQRVKGRLDDDEDNEQVTKTNPFDGTLNCFLMAWFIAGLFERYNNLQFTIQCNKHPLCHYSQGPVLNGVAKNNIPYRREPYRRVPLGRVHLDERRLDEVQ